MKLKFKQQQYQNDAVKSVVDCFQGQKKGNRRDIIARYMKINNEGLLHETSEEIEEIAYGNIPISLTSDELRGNIRQVQQQNDITLTDDVGLSDFTIEMETGTGKTYTYIKTMYELNKAYGWSKFIVMTPSVAIREGVKKSFEVTQEHFQEQYKKKIRFFIYNSKNSSNVANINTFASDDSIQVMIINFQAFTSKSAGNKKIYKELDELQSRKPIDVIKSVRPILIVDEPQKFGEKTEKLFEEFNPLFTVRYSATHKKNKEYNKVYRLDAVDAYNQKLVKRINVKGIEVVNNKSDNTYLFLDSVDISDKHYPRAFMEIEVKMKSGIKRKLVRVEKGDDLYTKSGFLEAYKGYVVNDVNCKYDEDKVIFTNGKEIKVGQACGDITEKQIARIQIRETIKAHFEKERFLFHSGIKVLSLFFIDEVAKYKDWSTGTALKGEYALMFEEEYNNALAKYRTLDDIEYTDYLDSFDTGKIHAGYFSVDKKWHEVESKINDKKEYLSFDEDAYDLIMKDKERLLSLEEPVRFIFSHSALREGWDNPNIFQICTLKHSNSEISKRQEIGRGLRICVNNDGDRMDEKLLENDFHLVNTLTVIASESYETFAKELQREIYETLTARPRNFSAEYFIGKKLKSENGTVYTFDYTKYVDLITDFSISGYVDRKNDYKPTEKLIEDIKQDKVSLLPELEPYRADLMKLLNKLYCENKEVPIGNDNKIDIKDLKPNDNFSKKEFQELWDKINVKTVYQVSFDSDELVRKAVNAINEKLEIGKTRVRITEGTQKDKISEISVGNSESMTQAKSSFKVIDDMVSSQVKYDLIGEIAKETGLTRKTVIRILKEISLNKFAMYKYSPDDFILKISNLINEEKATTVIDGITYHKIEEKYSNEIFTVNNISGQLGKNALEVNKHIYNYLVTDSDNEIKFGSKIDIADEITVYAKLPNGFKIPTPVGNYNPDWAIVFDNKNDDIKYIYFIAETKGTMQTTEITGVEKAKIECAKKHFESISGENVVYKQVSNYDELINIVSGI